MSVIRNSIGLLSVIFVCCLVGPAIWAIAKYTLYVMECYFTSKPCLDSRMLLLTGAINGYTVGFIAAVLLGLLMEGWRYWYGQTFFLVPLAASLIFGALINLAIIPDLSLNRPAKALNDWPADLLSLGLSAVVCWALCARFLGINRAKVS